MQTRLLLLSVVTLVLPKNAAVITNFFTLCRIHFSFFLFTWLFIMPVFFNIGKYAGSFTCFRKTAESFFKRFFFANINAVHVDFTYSHRIM